MLARSLADVKMSCVGQRSDVVVSDYGMGDSEGWVDVDKESSENTQSQPITRYRNSFFFPSSTNTKLQEAEIYRRKSPKSNPPPNKPPSRTLVFLLRNTITIPVSQTDTHREETERKKKERKGEREGK